MHQNNKVHQEIFKVGLLEQQVTLMENKIIIVAKSKRIPVLEIVGQSSVDVSRMIDRLINIKYKELLEQSLIDRFGFQIDILLRDYDPGKNTNAAIVILKESVEEYLAG